MIQAYNGIIFDKNELVERMADISDRTIRNVRKIIRHPHGVCVYLNRNVCLMVVAVR